MNKILQLVKPLNESLIMSPCKYSVNCISGALNIASTRDLILIEILWFYLTKEILIKPDYMLVVTINDLFSYSHLNSL